MADVDLGKRVSGISPFVLALREELSAGSMKRRGSFALGDLDVEVCEGRDSIWAIVRREGRGGLALRTAYVPGGGLTCRVKVAEPGEALRLEVDSALGRHRICFATSGPDLHRLRATVRFTPAMSLRIPFIPRDLYPLDSNDDPVGVGGNVEAAQRGLNSGLVYFRLDEPEFGSVLYFQNLTALNPYFEATGTKPDGVVGGEWPELGYLAPTPESQEVADPSLLGAGEEIVLSDAILVVRDWAGDNEQEMARQFVQMLGAAYTALDLPEVEYRDWVARSERTLRDLETAKQARRHEYGHLYVMPYPDGEQPDVMVQLSVIQALHDWNKWNGRKQPLEAELKRGLEKFYEEYAIPADSFARAVEFAMSQPDDVDINEILFRPTRQEL